MVHQPHTIILVQNLLTHQKVYISLIVFQFTVLLKFGDVFLLIFLNTTFVMYFFTFKCIKFLFSKINKTANFRETEVLCEVSILISKCLRVNIQRR